MKLSVPVVSNALKIILFWYQKNLNVEKIVKMIQNSNMNFKVNVIKDVLIIQKFLKI